MYSKHFRRKVRYSISAGHRTSGTSHFSTGYSYSGMLTRTYLAQIASPIASPVHRVRAPHEPRPASGRWLESFISLLADKASMRSSSWNTLARSIKEPQGRLQGQRLAQRRVVTFQI